MGTAASSCKDWSLVVNGKQQQTEQWYGRNVVQLIMVQQGQHDMENDGQQPELWNEETNAVSSDVANGTHIPRPWIHELEQ